MRLSLLLLCSCAAAAAAQNVQTITYDKLGAAFPEPFSRVVGLRELPDHRVVVADQLEGTVSAVDFATGNVIGIGRQGQGPGEYGMPGRLYSLAGDTTLMVDFATMRALVLAGDGVVESVPLTAGNGLPFFPQGVDVRGRLYSGTVLQARAPGAGTPAMGDSLPIARLDPTTDAVDTVAWMGQAAVGGGVTIRTGGSGSMRVGSGMQPYAMQDAWTVAPDGRVAIVRAQPYRVEWIANGKRTTGPEVPYTPVKIGSAEKEEWADVVAGSAMMIRTVGGEGGGARALRPQRPNVDEYEWPAAKPPFERQSVYVTPEGELWVLTSQRAGAKRQRFDVMDGQGRLVRRVELADGRRLVGFGRGTLYTVRRDADDLEWLERYQR